MDLTTTARFKAYRDVSAATDDTLIGYLVTAVSAQIEDHLDRDAETTSRTVYLDVEPDQRVFSLKGYPVTSVTSAHNDVDWTFGGTTLLDATDYTVLGSDGLLHFPTYLLATGPRALKVVYTGGMAATTADFYAAYPQVELATWMQVGYQFTKRKFLADTSSAIAGSSTGFQVPALLPEVKELLRPHRRVAIL